MFICDKCGSCCRNLDKSALYSTLNRGDGVCKFLLGNSCSIYNNRPLLCRVDESYDIFFNEIMSYEDYCLLNKQECNKLQNMEG